jgi:hypothetical protein
VPKLKKDGTISHQGEGGGKPPIFKTEEELKSKLFEYLEYCEKKKQMPNIAGFCFFVGMHRDNYYEYSRKYSDTIKDFESGVENIWVNRLSSNGSVGAIFYLKNAFREFYKDKTETDLTSKGEKLQPLLVEFINDAENN